MDDIKKLRESTHMSQAQFASHFGIPESTLKKWEQGTRKPPEYVGSMIKQILEYENKIPQHEN